MKAETPHDPACDPPPEYAAIKEKVDAFFAAVVARRGDDLACRSGCAACCHVELTVSAVEAAAIAAYLRSQPKRQRQEPKHKHSEGEAAPSEPRCAMLRDDDTCAIYPVRPLVCRSQGLPMLYAQELVPLPLRRGKGKDGRALVVCPQNFTDPQRPPDAGDILDAERVDVLVGLLNQRFAALTGTSPLERYALSDLAEEFLENL
jgi:hypothetical protein